MLHENPSVAFWETRQAKLLTKLLTGYNKTLLNVQYTSLRLIDWGSADGMYNASVTEQRRG
jgi:hypothetical protein